MPSITFHKTDANVILRYEPYGGSEFVYKRLKIDGEIPIRRTFRLLPSDLYGDSAGANPDLDAPVEFVIANKVDGYFEFDRRILGIDFVLYIHQSVDLHYRAFTAEKNVSIFSRVDELGLEELYIGGSHPGCLPTEDFEKLTGNFPNAYELRKYVLARVNAVLGSYIETERDGEQDYRKYMNHKISKIGSDMGSGFREIELAKFSTIAEKLTHMLGDEDSYNEVQWQEEILQIILLLYPKYIRAFKEAPVHDAYSGKERKLDLLLVDASGNTDIIEIKQPFEKCIVTNRTYRDNHVPLRELSGTVMQVEKYIFYLNKSGRSGEERLTKKYALELPDDFSIKITSPSGIIIMGRDNNLSLEQKQDFEVIKRKYKSVIDIMTYDDLIRRVQVKIAQLKKAA